MCIQPLIRSNTSPLFQKGVLPVDNLLECSDVRNFKRPQKIRDTHIAAWVPKATQEEIIYVYESINWEREFPLKIYPSPFHQEKPSEKKGHFAVMSRFPLSFSRGVDLTQARKLTSLFNLTHNSQYFIPTSSEAIAVLSQLCIAKGSLEMETGIQMLCSDDQIVHVENSMEITITPKPKTKTDAQIYLVIRI